MGVSIRFCFKGEGQLHPKVTVTFFNISELIPSEWLGCVGERPKYKTMNIY